MHTVTEKSIRRIKRTYALALSFVALTLIASSGLMQRAINLEKNDSRVINLSGRQRMLSQRLTKAVLALSLSPSSGPEDRSLGELRQALAEWSEAQAGLQRGDARLGLPQRELSGVIRELFREITPYHERMVAAVAALLQSAQARALNPRQVRQTAAAMLADEPYFLALMDKITFQFDAEASRRIQVLQRLEMIVLGFGLLVLALEYAFVFRPTLGRMSGLLASRRMQGEQLLEANAKLQASLEESQRLTELARTADAAKSEFLSRMSHEIRTPLNAVIGMTHLALKTELTPRQEDYLDKIRSSADILLGVINDILDFSKIEAGRLTIEHIPFDLENLLADVVNITSLGAAQKQLEFLLSVEEGVPTGLVGDPLRLRQILLNLVGNAVKFTESGEVVLLVELESGSETAVHLRFAVRDTGIGLSPDQVEQLFAPFSQGDGSISRRYGGTGLGLSISRRLVELMGGRLEVQSEPGLGSEFYFSLAFPQADVAGACLRPHALDLAGLKVLVVDDNATSRRILGDMLLSMRFAVITAASGEQALRLLHRPETDVRIVLLDWKMPGMDGTECARRILALGLARPPAIIMVTAHGREDVRRNAEDIGVRAFLLKPVARSVLFDTIAATIGLPSGPQADRPCEASSDMGLPERFRGARVLLVEDNEINQQIGRELLEGAGLVVDVVADGHQALEQVGCQTYAVVLMDVQMPVMDGLEATRRIRADPRHAALPIIAMTAHALEQDRRESLAAGMNDHVGKPIDPRELFAALERWMLPANPPAPCTVPGEASKDTAPLSASSGEELLPAPGNEAEEGERRQALLQELEGLFALLVQNDTQAQAVFEALAARLDRFVPEATKPLGDALRRFDFREARQLGETVRAALREQDASHES